MFSPASCTLQQAIQNDNLLTWPVINKINLKKFIIDTTAIEMGNMKQEKKHVRTTKSPHIQLDPPTRIYELHSQLIPFTAKELTYGNMTGAFPYTFTQGNKYIYLLYNYDSNGILVHPLKTRQAVEITNAWEHLHRRMTKHGHTIKHFILDNEMSATLKRAFTKNGVT